MTHMVVVRKYQRTTLSNTLLYSLVKLTQKRYPQPRRAHSH